MSIDRRTFLNRSLGGFGSLAFAGLAGKESRAAGHRHHAARANAVIHLYMDGGPSQIDTFDPKPELRRWADKPLPFQPPTTVFNTAGKVMPSPFEFRQHGESGTAVSEIISTVGDNPISNCPATGSS